ncbi:MAG: hypothetical protein OEU26_18500 [Candidatus Tectomicrobia bacterium]|nr:hypothetical protein [Candidatus Tectomicrobia bacterium]
MPWCAALAQASPTVPAPLLLPGDDGPGRDALQGVWSAWPPPGSANPEQAIGWAELGARDRLIRPGKRMSPGNQCHLKGKTGLKPGQDRDEKDQDDGGYDR